MEQEQSVLPRASDLQGLAGRPARVIEHPRWAAARDAVIARITGGPCLVLLLGPAGSGKTLLLRSLAKLLSATGRRPCLLDFGDSQAEIGPADVVLVDEADRMSPARLDDLSRRGGCATVLAVLPSAAGRFEHYPGVTVVRLAPLSSDQACAFLAERLGQLGLPVGCLTEAARTQLIDHSHGVPRLLIALLGLALFLAAEDGAERVTGAYVQQAVAVRGGDPGQNAVEPVPAQPDHAPRDVPQFLATEASVPGPSDAAEPGSAHGRRRLAAVLTAVCLFTAVAALLSLGRVGDHRRAPSSESGTAPATAPAPRPVVSPQPASTAQPGGTASPRPAPAAPMPVAVPAPAAVTAPSATPALPWGAIAHVVLIYPRGDPAAQQRGLDLARTLRSDGISVGDPLPATPHEAKRGINYYFSQDQGAAAAIGRRLDGKYGEGRLVRLPRNTGLPRPGTIEIAVGSD